MIGKKIGGRYECLDRVGGGGMAVVFKAKDLLLDRIVAVKILRPQYAIDDDFVHRFRREAQAAASLSHPNVVSIYDVGIEEETHYIVMEYVEGSTLKEHITDYGPLPIEEAVHITKQIAGALGHAHDNQIIHRDIKPHNILIGKNGQIKVTDFGIARAVTSSTITHTGSVIGSVHYFSPEQARGGMTGEKSDLYSLGVVLYEMVTGYLPFSGDSPISVALKHLQESFTEPRALNNRIPQSVENIILRSLAKDPLQRYTSAQEMIKDLDTCLQANRISEEKYSFEDSIDEEATKVLPAINEEMFDTKVVQRETNDHHQEDGEEEEEENSKRPLWYSLGIILVTLLLVGVGTYLGIKFVSNIFSVQTVEVEDVTNLSEAVAVTLLEEQGLHVGNRREDYSGDVEEGHVMKQDPPAKSVVKENSYVHLTISKGKEKIEMPSMIENSESIAKNILASVGFLTENITETRENHDQIPAGFIISQVPDSEELVVPDETNVELVISDGPETFPMPNLIGLNEEQAKGILNQHNLVIEEIQHHFSDKPIGEVIDQYPLSPNQEVEAGTPITLWVSKGYEEVFREKEVEITVTIEEENNNNNGRGHGEGNREGNQPHASRVVIYITDEERDNEQVQNETINETKTYTYTLKVSRDQDGSITVFKDGELYDRQIITFE